MKLNPRLKGVVWSCYIKMVFFKNFLQNSQENTCARVFKSTENVSGRLLRNPKSITDISTCKLYPRLLEIFYLQNFLLWFYFLVNLQISYLIFSTFVSNVCMCFLWHDAVCYIPWYFCKSKTVLLLRVVTVNCLEFFWNREV